MNSTKTLMIFSVLAVIIVLTSGCFITNCPPGGKRSAPSHRVANKQCTRCGPSGVGRCFGPDICCGPSIGCHLNNRFTAICSTEDYSPHPCHNEGKMCANGKGVCALESICCTSEGCFVDKLCQQNVMKNSNEEKIWSNAIETVF